MNEEEPGKKEKIYYWEVFFDDIYLLFFLSIAVMYIFYTVWGLMELGTVGYSPLVSAESASAHPHDGGGAAKAEAPAVAKNYWADWKKGKAQGPMPDCGVNVLALGGDDILQATVDIYCGVKPGSYTSKINPDAWDCYEDQCDSYPDGKTGVLIFEDIGVVFTTEMKGGMPIYDVLVIANEQSAASTDPGHPLNPKTCEKCHAEFDQVCVGFVCGNRF